MCFFAICIYISIILSVNPGVATQSGKTKKNDKSQENSGKNGGFWKKSGIFFFKYQILSVQIYQIPYI